MNFNAEPASSHLGINHKGHKAVLSLVTPDESRHQNVAVFSPVVKSAKRVLEVFELFADQRHPLSVSDVVRHLGYPQSSASGLLKSLAKLGYLQYDRYKRLYSVTLRAAFLGAWVQDQLFSRTSLQQLVDDLHETTGQTVVIGMQNGIFLQYIYLRQQPISSNPSYMRCGALRPLCRTAAGRMLLSLKRDSEVAYLLRRINAEEPEPSHCVSLPDLLAQLDEVRRQGYSYNEGTHRSDRGLIAVRIPGPSRQPPMAIGIGADLDVLRPNQKRYLSLLRAALDKSNVEIGRDDHWAAA